MVIVRPDVVRLIALAEESETALHHLADPEEPPPYAFPRGLAHMLNLGDGRDNGKGRRNKMWSGWC